MRLFLILLLTLVLPLKAAAGYVVALSGAPGHAHVAQTTADSPTAAHCAWMAQMGDDDSSNPAPHDHGCPHLAMVSIATTICTFDGTAAPIAPAPHLAPHFTSITLDVPRPPPTAA